MQRRPEFKRLEESFYKPMIFNLIARRKKLGLTQEMVNDEMGVAPYSVSKYEVGMRFPSLYHLLLWCEALKCDLILIQREVTMEDMQ